jgi:hypothetical protein
MPSELAHEGFAIFERVVPIDLCEAVVRAIGDFLGIDPDDPATFRETGEPVNGIVPIHQHPALWAVREHPALYAIFRELLGERALWVTMDRCGFKPPNPGAPDAANEIHLDKDPLDLREPALQALVYLRDTSIDQAAFECVPSLYREIVANPHAWSGRVDPIDVRGHALVRVPGSAGSLLVWKTSLPHGSSHNRSARPRFTQYVTMFREGTEAERAERVELHRTSRAPSWWREIPGQIDPEPWPPATLTVLGRQLLGAQRW